MNHITVLGSSGSKYKNMGTTSFLISKNIAIDAGNIINSLQDKAHEVNHIFLTHAHLDHIIDIPFMLDNCFTKRENTLKIYASFDTINFLKENIFNNKIWPDFTKIKLYNKELNSLEYIAISENSPIEIDGFSIKAIGTKHCLGSFGFCITKNDSSYIITGDIGLEFDLISKIAEVKNLKALFTECSFPNSLERIALISNHLTPNYLKEFLSKLDNKNLALYLYHLKLPHRETIIGELKELDILNEESKILEDGDVIYLDNLKVCSKMSDSELIDKVMNINLQLSSEKDKDSLYEMILTLIRELTKCDGGTLYLLSEDKKSLEFTVVQNESLGVFLGSKGEKINWKPLPIYLENGEVNRNMVAVCCVLDKKIINIQDIYNNKNYNFEGAKLFDQEKNYLSRSMLVVPLINHEKDVIGVIQLINKDLKESNGVFNAYDEKIIKALSLQAAMALTNTILIDSLEEFLEAFVDSIAEAIDAKSSHTSTHIGNISRLAPLIAQSIHEDNTIYKNINYSKNDFKEIELAAKLHDVGKISIPEWVIDKATKLQNLIDGFELIKLRVEIIKKTVKIEFLEGNINKEEYEFKINQLEDDLEFLRKTNIGGEFMKDEDIERINSIGKTQYIENGVQKTLLSEDEIYNLSIRKGTLTKEEKDIMNSHADLSYEMLSKLPFPKKYSNVMHIAVNHHEKLNGKGYPRGLSASELVLEDRILILADVFEALTSTDRPYKGIKKLSEVFRILDFMAKDGEIDKDLLEFFKQSSAFNEYARTTLLDEQKDV